MIYAKCLKEKSLNKPGQLHYLVNGWKSEIFYSLRNIFGM